MSSNRSDLAEETDVRTTFLAAAGMSALMATGCAHGIRIDTGTEPPPRLSEYHTFFILPGHSSGSRDADQRIQSDISTAFEGKGWIEVPRNEAEAVVVIHTATPDSRTSAAFYQGWGGWGWRQTSSPTAGSGDYKVGSLIVDIFDARTKRAVWHGVATDAVPDYRSKKSRLTDTAVQKMFRDLPNTETTYNQSLPSLPAVVDLPEIVFAQSPALLVRVEGDPLYRAVDGTGLSRITNTRSFIVRDESGIHYLRIPDVWMQAYALTGWWSPAGTVPDGAEAALREAVDANVVDKLDLRGSVGTDNDGAGLPTVYVSTMPVELIVTDGTPEYVPMGGTSLLYVKNTSSHVFKEPTDQEIYVFASGRWFRAWTSDGPWQPLATDELPADLAKVSDTLLQNQ